MQEARERGVREEEKSWQSAKFPMKHFGIRLFLEGPLIEGIKTSSSNEEEKSIIYMKIISLIALDFYCCIIF